MSPKLTRTFAIILISAAILGWVISLGGTLLVWGYRPRATQAAVSQVKVLRAGLELTTAGLEVTQKSLTAVVSGLEGLQATVNTTAETVKATTPFLESLIGVAENSLPTAVEAVQKSVDTAQDGAKVIDNVLRAISAIPLLNGRYNPTTPLDEALDNVSQGLAALPENFAKMSDSLSSARDGINAVEDGITNMAADIGAITASLQEAQTIIGDYLETAEMVLDFLKAWENRIPQLITILAVIFTIFFVWIAATQLGLLLQGLQLYHNQQVEARDQRSEASSQGSQTGDPPQA